MLGKALTTAAAGNAAGEALGIEDVFSTWLYTGTGSTQTITNGIDLAGEGGLVWLKERSVGTNGHLLFDTARVSGSNEAFLQSNTTGAEIFNNYLTYNSNGFSLLTASNGINVNSVTYASWTFRKAPGFFDVVTYTGNGTNQSIAHNLGSVPGCIMFKNLDTTAHWVVYHRGISVPANKGLALNETWAEDDDVYFNDTAPTSTHFTVGAKTQTNGSGNTIVAYLFAHDEQIFGEGGDQSVIKCGSYTGTGSNGNVINLGWEPQWVLIKNASAASTNWVLYDTMRGMPNDGSGVAPALVPNLANAESTLYPAVIPLATGFQVDGNSTFTNTSPNTFIYIAIRRGPMKTPTDATKVFSVAATGTNGNGVPTIPTDAVLSGFRNTNNQTSTWQVVDRLRGFFVPFAANITGQTTTNPFLQTNTTAAESTSGCRIGFPPASSIQFYNLNTGVPVVWPDGGFVVDGHVDYFFRRAPGFFDVVAYTGTGSNRSLNHNLGVIPELMIAKKRSGADNWPVYSAALGTGVAAGLRLNTTDSAGYNNGTRFYQTPTASLFYVGTDSDINASGQTYITYLFATCPGVSKCFNYTGTGTTLQINCGFTNGARFVMIKRTDSTGDWYVWDSARGIISGNDSYLLLNSTAAEVTNTDYIDPYSAGFEISSTAPAAINANGGSYIGLAIA